MVIKSKILILILTSLIVHFSLQQVYLARLLLVVSIILVLVILVLVVIRLDFRIQDLILMILLHSK